MITTKETLKKNLTYSCGHRHGKREGYAKGYNDAKFDIKSKIVTFCVRATCWILIAATFYWFCYEIFTATGFCSFLILIIPFGILWFLYRIENRKTEKIIKKIAIGLAIALLLISIIGIIPAYKKQEIKSLASKTMYYNTDSYVNGYLNVRESPNGDIVYSLKEGESVVLTGKSKFSFQLNHWFWAETEDGYWVSFRLLTTQKK